MGLGDIFSRLMIAPTCNTAVQNSRKVYQDMELSNFSLERDPKTFMDSLKSITAAQATEKVCEYIRKNGRMNDDLTRHAITEIAYFIQSAAQASPADVDKDFLGHVVDNTNTRLIVGANPNMGLSTIRRLCSRMQGQDGLNALAVLEKDGTFFPNIIRGAEKTHAADLFINLLEGLPDDVAVSRLRISRSFQAGLQADDSVVFWDYLMKNKPVLLQAIDQNFSTPKPKGFE